MVFKSFRYLNQRQQELINNYINFRNNSGKIIYRDYKSKKYVSDKDDNLRIERSIIASSFLKIIAGRCGIDIDEVNSPKFNTNIFDPYDIMKSDYFLLAKGMKSSTLHSKYKVLKRFYFWILQELIEKEDIENFESYKTLKKFELNVDFFLNQFPKRNEHPDDEIVQKKVKTFLNRACSKSPLLIKSSYEI